MKQTQVEIGGTCHLTKTEYGENVRPDITLDYIEHSSDHYHSDNETSLDINKEKAIEIVKFLQDVFDVSPLTTLGYDESLERFELLVGIEYSEAMNTGNTEECEIAKRILDIISNFKKCGEVDLSDEEL